MEYFLSVLKQSVEVNGVERTNELLEALNEESCGNYMPTLAQFPCDDIPYDEQVALYDTTATSVDFGGVYIEGSTGLAGCGAYLKVHVSWEETLSDPVILSEGGVHPEVIKFIAGLVRLQETYMDLPDEDYLDNYFQLS